MKKKLIAVLLMGCLALAACGEKEAEAEAETAVEAETETEESEDNAAAAADGLEVVDETIESAGIDAFVIVETYEGLELEKNIYTVTDEDIDAQIQSELASLPVENTDTSLVVETGDTINLDYSGSIDGVVFDGGTAEDQLLEIGSGTFIPGFEDQIIGMKVGESGDINVTFPEDYGSAELAGKEAVFAITVNAITEYVTEMTDEWLLQNTTCATADEYKEYIRSSLESQNENTSMNELATAAWEIINGSAVFNKLPQDLVDSWYADQVNSVEYYASMYGYTYEEYLDTMGMTEDNLMEYAIENTKVSLVTEYVCQKLGITEDSEVYQTALTEFMMMYGLSSLEDAEAYGMTELLVDSYVKQECMIKHILDHAVITEVEAVVPEE